MSLRSTPLHVLAMSLVAAFAVGVTGSLNASGTTSASDEKTEGSAKVELTAGTWKDVEAIVAASKGKIVVVDVWSTSCEPCMREFPHLVTLHNEQKDQMVCVSLNVTTWASKASPRNFTVHESKPS